MGSRDALAVGPAVPVVSPARRPGSAVLRWGCAVTACLLVMWGAFIGGSGMRHWGLNNRANIQTELGYRVAEYLVKNHSGIQTIEFNGYYYSSWFGEKFGVGYRLNGQQDSLNVDGSPRLDIPIEQFRRVRSYTPIRDQAAADAGWFAGDPTLWVRKRDVPAGDDLVKQSLDRIAISYYVEY